MTMNDLCCDLLERIFGNLNHAHLLKCIAVNKLWRDMVTTFSPLTDSLSKASQESFWKKCYIEEWGDDRHFEGVSTFIQSFRHRQEMRPCMNELLLRWVKPGRSNKEECAVKIVEIAQWLLKDLSKKCFPLQFVR